MLFARRFCYWLHIDVDLGIILLLKDRTNDTKGREDNRSRVRVSHYPAAIKWVGN